jgi:hypothetical protein
MRGKAKLDQPVILKHVEDPIVMHIDKISGDGKRCTCVWHDKVGAPYRTEFNTAVLEVYKPASSGSSKKLRLVEEPEE